jgi:stage V sporulation protein D (sporulation-specific penicillin-binding protein)
MGVPRRKNQIEKETSWTDEKWLEVPNFIGKSKIDVFQSYYNFDIKAYGNGNTIIAQSPDAGKKVKVGLTIQLYLVDN